MKTFSFEVGRSRAVLMAALGMMVGWVLINWVGRNTISIHLDILRDASLYTGGNDRVLPCLSFYAD